MIYKRLSNGLTVCLIPKEGYIQKEAMLAFGCGSVDIEFDNYRVPHGTAHFVEHKMFDKRHGNTFEDFSRLGLGATVNAFTSLDTTAYHFTCTDNLTDCLALLARTVTEPHFTRHGVEKELEIIKSEVAMYEDNAEWLAHFGMLKGLYGEHPISVPIAGKREELDEITADTLQLFYDSLYTADNAILTVAGAVTEELFDTVEELFTLPTHRKCTVKPTKTDKIASASVKYRKPIGTSVYSIGFKDNDTKMSPVMRQLTAEVLLELLCGRSSVLYERLFNHGLCTAPPSIGYLSCRGCGTAVISGTSPNPEKLLSMLCREVENYLSYGITAQAIERVVTKKLGELKQNTDDLDFCCLYTTDNFVKSIKTLDIPDKYGSINSDELVRRLKELFAPDRVCLCQVTTD
jgi:predicted Zn-dependent peptidase